MMMTTTKTTTRGASRERRRFDDDGSTNRGSIVNYSSLGCFPVVLKVNSGVESRGVGRGYQMVARDPAVLAGDCGKKILGEGGSLVADVFLGPGKDELAVIYSGPHICFGFAFS